ncbi:MAG: hypothetical protein HRT47_07200 [Candidatus Caenarcaniphilales bacterium]|nr:hypothetical protein [Candidatus Caenarcaniphilales bacterium]
MHVCNYSPTYDNYVKNFSNESLLSLNDEERVQDDLINDLHQDPLETKLFKNLDKAFTLSSLLYFISSGFALVPDEKLKSIGDKTQRAAYLTEVVSWIGRGTLDPEKKMNPGLVIPTALSAVSTFFESDSFLGRFSRYLTHLGNVGVSKLHAEHVLDSEDAEHEPIRKLLHQAKEDINYKNSNGVIDKLLEDTNLTFKLAEQAIKEPKLLLETFKSLAGAGKFNIPHVHSVSAVASIALAVLTAGAKLLPGKGLSNILLTTLNVSPSVFAFAGAANVQNMKDNYLRKFGKLEQVANVGHLLSNLVAYSNTDLSVMVLQPIFSGIKNIAMAFESKKLKSS